MPETRSFKARRQPLRTEKFKITYEVLVPAAGNGDGPGEPSETWVEREREFTAHLPIPDVLLMDSANMRIDENSIAFRDIFKAALRDEFDEFWTFIKDPDVLIDAETIGEIYAWFAEDATGRPTTPS